jgi:hypothetical protein
VSAVERVGDAKPSLPQHPLDVAKLLLTVRSHHRNFCTPQHALKHRAGTLERVRERWFHSVLMLAHDTSALQSDAVQCEALLALCSAAHCNST